MERRFRHGTEYLQALLWRDQKLVGRYPVEWHFSLGWFKNGSTRSRKRNLNWKYALWLRTYLPFNGVSLKSDQNCSNLLITSSGISLSDFCSFVLLKTIFHWTELCIKHKEQATSLFSFHWWRERQSKRPLSWITTKNASSSRNQTLETTYSHQNGNLLTGYKSFLL